MIQSETKLMNWSKTALKQTEFSFVKKLIKKFPEAGVYLVGGAVRDLILGKPTKDFDFVVAKVDSKDLEKFLSQEGKVNLVGKSFGVFKFRSKGSPIKSGMTRRRDSSTSLGMTEGYGLEVTDIALPRTEHAGMSGGYKDFQIQSDKDLPIEKDLERRDFTINALAWDIKNEKIIDNFNGLADLKNKTIRAIGEPEKRFQEDYTRMLRAIRFSCQLGFEIEKETLAVIKKKAKKIITIATERINDELTKIIMTDNAEDGFRLMQEIGLIKILIPELEVGVGVAQNKTHIYEVFEHNVRALGVAAKRNFSLEIRLASLFHDIAKPQTKEGKGKEATFYNHDIEGAKVTKEILKRLQFSNEIIKKTTHLVRYHMFYYSLDIVSDAGVRRLLNRLGKENINDFINIRICDRLGMGRPKAKPWKLIQLERRFKEVQLEPINPKMLKIDGSEIIQELKLKPGPKIGLLLNALLGEILENPKKNTKKYLGERARELSKVEDKELKNMHPDIKYYEEERKRLLHKKIEV